MNRTLKAAHVALALLALPNPAGAATHLRSDPTGAQSGTSYADLVEYRGDGIDSTYIDVAALNFTGRRFVRLANLTINGNFGTDKDCSNIILDTVKVVGGITCSGDSSRFRDIIVTRGYLNIAPATFNSPADTLIADAFVERDTFQRINLYGEPSNWNTVTMRMARQCLYQSVRCSSLVAYGSNGAMFKMYLSDRNNLIDSRWSGLNLDTATNPPADEPNYWCVRDRSSFNTFTRDTVDQLGPGVNTVALSHAGNCGFSNWCDQQQDNDFDGLLVRNFGTNGANKILYQQYGEGDRITNSTFASTGVAFYFQYGIRNAVSSRKFTIRHSTFAALGNASAFEFPTESGHVAELSFTDNIVTTAKTGQTGRYASAFRINRADMANIDTMDVNLLNRSAADSCFWVEGTGARDIGGFAALTGLNTTATRGSPRFTDSTATLSFNATPLRTGYAIGSRWRHGYVGAIPPAVTDTVPQAVDSIYVAMGGTRVVASFNIPHDDNGVVGWQLWRSTTHHADYRNATLFADDYRVSAEPFAEGSAIVVPCGNQKVGVPWYYYVVVRDASGQVSAVKERTVTTASGGSTWTWDY